MAIEKDFRALVAKDQALEEIPHGTVLSVLDSEIGPRLYIRHEDFQTPTNGVAYFGPFSPEEVGERVNGALADMFACSGDVDVVELTTAEARLLDVNTREWWMEQEATYE